MADLIRTVSAFLQKRQPNFSLAAIVESAVDAIFSVTLDDTVSSWNTGAEHLFGFSAEEMVGSPLTLFMPATPKDLEVDRECLQTGSSAKNHEVAHRRKDGSSVTVSFTISPVRDATGQIIGLSRIGREITDRRQTDELLFLQANLLDCAYKPMIAWQLDGIIAYWNRGAEELYGFARTVAIGSSIHKLLQTTHPIPLPEILRQLESQTVWAGELCYITSEGVKTTVESALHLSKLPNGQTLVLQSDRDMSMFRQAETAMRQVYEELEQRVEERTHQLAEANQELESFSYSVSHDLRAPLRSLEGFTRILTMDYPAGTTLDDRALDLMRRMTASVTRMGQLIEDLLKLSQVSRASIHLQTVDLTAMSMAVLDDLSARDPQRKINLQIEPGVTAVADPRLLKLVLENLLGNAWKYTGKTAAPKIIVGASHAAGTSDYFIQDNGAGFDMAFADQLFAPFQRLHRATEFEGTGVGLATVQRVIHRHAGRIWAESSPGQGAKFMFTLGKATGSKRS